MIILIAPEVSYWGLFRVGVASVGLIIMLKAVECGNSGSPLKLSD